MKFCLLSMEPHSPNNGNISAVEQNSINVWGTVMGGKVFYGPYFDQGNYGLDYDYFNDFDLVMVAFRQELIEAGIKVKQKSKAKVVVFLDGALDNFTTHTPRSLQARMVELLNMVDAVAVLHDESIPLFQALTYRPVGLVGLPFPLERVRELCPPVRKMEEIELGSSVRSAPVRNRNALVNLAALSKIGMPGVIDILDPKEREYIRSIGEFIPLPQIRFRENNQGWDHYITRANYSLLGLHLDYRCTWGRFSAECAALGMPCVAPPSLYTQKILFPGLCVPHHHIHGAAELVKRLVSDANFYEETVSRARAQIEQFSYAQCKLRLLNLIG